MCGGAAPRSTIQTPDYKAYDRLANAQLATMQAAQSPAVLAAQQQVLLAAQQQQQTTADLVAAKTAAANDTSAASARIAALVGAPLPDKTAKAPVLGANRAGMTRPGGRRALRLDLQSAPAGGLNLGSY
jgi:hypothetical protein